MIVLDGSASVGGIDVRKSDVIFLNADVADVLPGPDGLRVLIAYASPVVADDLLREAEPAPGEFSVPRLHGEAVFGTWVRSPEALI